MQADDKGFGFFDEPEKPSSPQVPASIPVAADNSETELDESAEGQENYLFFTLGEHTYATPLLSVREIIEIPTLKKVPRAADYLLGVFNLRGDVAGLIDLAARLEYPTNVGPSPAVLVFETSHGFLGARVDQVITVQQVNKSNVIKNSDIQTRIQEDYLAGFVREGDKFVIVVELAKMLDADQFDKVHERIRKGA